MIYIAADHAGFELKEEIKKYLIEQNKEFEDLGAFELDKDDDYPDFIAPVAKKVAENPGQNRGIVFGGSGQGEAIVSNRFKGVRAAVYYGGNPGIVKLSRQHNDANVLSLGARFLTKEQALEAVELWLSASFEGGRHARR
ncbi:MAG: RpiB/LacA/LacB family sugar-phosphate isomerase, partial [Candidatus Wildermuthbacteria bacterium]|nr:RpiB/LacA/LacB family sugar-phosphate isomerase [Candidatus Wildermuthbacteria bacterium]